MPSNLIEFIEAIPSNREGIGDWFLKTLGDTLWEKEGRGKATVGQFLESMFSDACGTNTHPLSHLLARFLAHEAGTWSEVTPEQWLRLLEGMRECYIPWTYDEVLWAFFNTTQEYPDPEDLLGAFFEANLEAITSGPDTVEHAKGIQRRLLEAGVPVQANL